MRSRSTFIVLILLGAGASAAAAPLLVSGDRVVSNVLVREDVEEFVLEGTAGGTFSLSVAALDGDLGPALRLFDPAGDEVNLSPWVSLGPGTASLAGAVFGENGLHRLEVSGGGVTTGAFSLRYKAKAAKGLRAKAETLAPGASRSYLFAGAEGGSVKVAVKFRTPDARPTLVDLLDPELVSHAGKLAEGPRGLKGKFAATGTFGEWRLTLRNDGGSDAVYDVSIASKLPKRKKSSRTFPNVAVREVVDIHGTRVPISIDLWNPDGRTVTVRFSFSLDGGTQWAACLPVAGGANPVALGGGVTAYGFEWDLLAQVEQDLALSCAWLRDVRLRAEVLTPDGDGDEFHPAISPFELWAYPEPSREEVHAALIADLGTDGTLDGFVLVDTRTEADHETRHLPGAVARGPPHSFALGDFDGDLVPDLVTAEPGSTSVLLHPGNGDGTFGPSAAVGSGRRPSFLAADDLDGDGNLDLVHGNRESSEVTVLLGNGDGTFAPPSSFDAGRVPLALSLADLDGNSAPDLLLLAGRVMLPVPLDPMLFCFPGQGDGTFGVPIPSACGEDPSSLTVALLDGDAIPDVAVTNRRVHAPSFPPNVAVLLGHGDGSFKPPRTLAVEEEPACVAAGDFDLNGSADLAVVNRGSASVFVILNQGGAVFDPATNVDAGPRPNGLAVADLDGDTRPDLIVADRGHEDALAGTPAGVAVVLSQAGGTFASPVFFSAGEDPALVLTGDLDGDLSADVIVAHAGPDNRTVLLGTGDGGLTGIAPDRSRRFVFYCYGLG